MAKKKLSDLEQSMKKLAAVCMKYISDNTVDTRAKISVNLEEYINGSKVTGTSLNGITVSVQNITNNTEPLVKTWNGETLVFKNLSPLKNYRIAVQSISGYKVNYAYQDIINIDLSGDVTKTFTYETLEFTATMKSDQDIEGGAQDNSIDRTSSGVNLVVQYSYGGNTVQTSALHHEDKIKIPADVDTSTISVSSSTDVSGYAKTVSIDLANKKITLLYEAANLSGYIILDQTTSDPTAKVIDGNGNTYSQGYSTPAVINAIRNMSHCYVQQSFGNNVLSLKQLNDSDGTKYADGTSASNIIKTNNVFMRLPYFFTRVSTYETDKIKVEFWIDVRQTATTTDTPGEGWKQWGGNDLIGKYQGNCIDTGDNTTGTLRSISNATPTVSVSQTNFKQKARNNGDGFTCIKWRHQCIMAILFYAYYGHVNSQSIVGIAESGSNTMQSGNKNTLGMTDTNSTNGNTNGLVFWGLENWWGANSEFFDNVRTFSGTIFLINEDDGSSRDIGFAAKDAGSTIYPNALVLGENLDIIYDKNKSRATSETGYCDGQYITSSNCAAAKSGGSEYSAGVIGIVSYVSTSSGNSGITSRLAYKGNIEIA